MSRCSKLLSFRKLLVDANIQAYVVRTADCHNSEYLAPPDERISYLSGFTGSNATVVITKNQALLWTDGRYFDQASKELNSEWVLMKDRMPEVLPVETWLSTKLTSNSKTGFDAKLVTITEYCRYINAGVKMTPVEYNLVDSIWEKDESNPRPKYGCDKIFVLALDKAGECVNDKLIKLRKNIKPEESLVFTALDEIAWILNLRGRDIPYNPVFFSFLTLRLDSCILYINKLKLSEEVNIHLSAVDIQVKSYEEFWNDLKNTLNSKVLIPKYASVAIQNMLGDKFVLHPLTPVARLKGAKNAIEQSGMRAAHLKDAVAVCELLWEMSKHPESFDELTAEMCVDNLRATQADYVSPSFRTISGYGSNAAIIHYGASKETNKKIGIDSLFLVDSGGQYLQGTTDITRTVHFGIPTAYQKKCFTAVLKGHIALASSKFPANAAASRLDSIARKPLWDIGKDYNHGTGHGVGCFLNVHEGPFSISLLLANNETLYPGAVVSIEPGYYETDNFGIRIENLMLCKADDIIPDFLCFENLTLVPIDQKLIDIDMLTSDEIKYLNDYHSLIRTVLMPELAKQAKSQEMIDWISEVTEGIINV